MTNSTEKRPYVKGGTACTADECDRPAKARGLCPSHYARAYRGSKVDGAIRPPRAPECSFDGCEGAVHGQGLCTGHYAQQREGRALTPLRERRSPVGECDVDTCERAADNGGLCRTHYDRRRQGREDWDAPIRPKAPDGSGYLDGRDGYRFITIDGVQRREHVVIMEGLLGRPLAPGENVHHINGQRADNRPANLELWNTRQPAGQRPEDKVEFALEMLRLYAPERLAVSHSTA